MGLSLESIIGYAHDSWEKPTCTTSEESLETLVEQANHRFIENTKRIERFRSLLKKLSSEDSSAVKKKGQEGGKWEDPQVRRERKRAEGLAKSQQMRSSQPEGSSENVQEAPSLDLLDLDP
jgi:tRNA wybutosine-synthesizing protein 3